MPADKGLQQLHVSVRDTGIGITLDQQRTIFYAFTQAAVSAAPA